MLAGCHYFPLLRPSGPIGEVERNLIILVVALMLIVVVPVHVLTFRFIRRYRASEPTGPYQPRWSHSARLDSAIWAVPIAIVVVIAYFAWTRTFQLDPYRRLAGHPDPIRVEAVSMNWKWLFIYPDHDVAVVNQLVFPARTPVSFRVTSQTVMTSFFIPALGSQIYAMAGMTTRLHLLADRSGTYAGHNQQFSGAGYSTMHFDAIATAPADFETWVRKARQSPEKLDWERYQRLTAWTKGYPVTTFSSVSPGLFDRIVHSFHSGGPPANTRLHPFAASDGE